jgi:hypothetical protein
MTSRFMRSCAAVLFATVAATTIVQAAPAGRCLIEAGAARLKLTPSEAFMRAPGRQAVSQRVLSLVARNVGHFDVEMAFDGPFAGATPERQIELMTSIADELGLRGAPEADSEPASTR